MSRFDASAFQASSSSRLEEGRSRLSAAKEPLLTAQYQANGSVSKPKPRDASPSQVQTPSPIRSNLSFNPTPLTSSSSALPPRDRGSSPLPRKSLDKEALGQVTSAVRSKSSQAMSTPMADLTAGRSNIRPSLAPNHKDSSPGPSPDSRDSYTLWRERRLQEASLGPSPDSRESSMFRFDRSSPTPASSHMEASVKPSPDLRDSSTLRRDRSLQARIANTTDVERARSPTPAAASSFLASLNATKSTRDSSPSPLQASSRSRAPEPNYTSRQGASATDEVMNGRSQDIVQFCTSTFYAMESEQKVVISLMRIGALKDVARVTWETQDITARSGEKYKGGTGVLRFEPGQDHAEFEIEIISKDTWECIKQFKVTLKEAVNCELGHYLFECHVNIVDVDTFPSDRYASLIREGEEGIEKIPSRSLMFDFLKHCFQMVPGVARRSCMILIFDQLQNIFYFLRTYLVSIYMVDVLFSDKPEGKLWLGTQQNTAFLVAALLAAPVLVLHAWTYRKTKMNVAGDLRRYFQTCLVSMYFNYDEMERADIPIAEVQTAIRIESREIVESAFMKCFTMLSLIGKLVIVALFTLREDKSALWVVILFPVCTLWWLKIKITPHVKFAEHTIETETWLMEHVHVALRSFRLISDYGKRPQETEEIGIKLKTWNDVMLEQEMQDMNNLKFPDWLANGLTVAYIVIFSGRVIDKTLSLGTFLAMVKVFSELGNEFKEAFEQMMELTGAIGPLRKITRLMNGRLDVQKALKKSRYDLEQTFANRKAYKKVGYMSSMEIIDSIPIVIDGKLHFTYADEEGESTIVSIDTSKAPRDSQGQWSLRVQGEDLHFKQGTMVSVFGAHGSGKATVLRLISGISYPAEGNVYVPAQLRLLHVSSEPVLIERSLWGNLVFGCVREPSKERVFELVRRIEGEPRELQNRLKLELEDEELKNGDGEEWRATLSQTSQSLIHLIRALVMNPEMLVLHRPGASFGDERQRNIMRMLREHVTEKGLEMGSDPKSSRRPRTVVYSTDFRWMAQKADTRLQLVVNDKVSILKMFEKD